MKILLTEQDIRRMVKKAVHCIMEERIKDVNLDPSNFISGNGITGIYKTKSSHLFDRCDERNIAQLAGTPFKHIISLTTVGYWTGESDTPIKSDLVSVHLGSDNQVFKDSLERQSIMLKRRIPNNISSNGGEMDDWYKKRDPKNDKKKKFGYGADYVSENKKKLTNR